MDKSKKLIAVEIELGYTANDPETKYARIPCEYIGVYQLSGLTYKGRTKEDIPVYWVNEFALSIDRNYKGCIYDKNREYPGRYVLEFLEDYDRNLWVYRIYDNGEKDKVLPNNRGDDTTVLERKKRKSSYATMQLSGTNKHGDMFIEFSAYGEVDTIFPDEIINADTYTVGEMIYSED